MTLDAMREVLAELAAAPAKQASVLPGAASVCGSAAGAARWAGGWARWALARGRRRGGPVAPHPAAAPAAARCAMCLSAGLGGPWGMARPPNNIQCPALGQVCAAGAFRRA